MTFSLALKNSRLYFRKRLPMAVFIAATLALLFVGNTVFYGTEQGLARTFRTSLTGDLSLSAASDDSFTLFGSDTPLIGEFFKMPVILNYASVSEKVGTTLPKAQLQPIVVGVAKVSRESFSAPVPWFAANLSDYFAFFPTLKVLSGSPPQPGTPGLFLNERLFKKATASLGKAPKLGDLFLLTAAQEGSFSLREVPLAGVFSYPTYDPILENVVLVDVGTGRALAGYYVTKSESQTETEGNLTSVDDLFTDASDTSAPTNDGLSFEKVTKDLAEQTTAPQEDSQSWNFLLVRTDQSVAASLLLQQAVQTTSSPVQVRDWRDTAGGNAKILWFIQLLFNLGLVFISVVAGLVVMNSMSLAVVERIRELGTMRALGATRTWVARLVFWETIVLVMGSGVAGVALGGLGVALVDALGGVPISNPFLAGLLGTTIYRPEVSWWLMLQHVGVSLGIGMFATLLPVRKVLQILPLHAMARG